MRFVSRCVVTLAISCTMMPTTINGFVVPVHRRTIAHNGMISSRAGILIKSEITSTSTTTFALCASVPSAGGGGGGSTLGGVVDFEKWFGSNSGAACSPNVHHTAFGPLRGLSYDGTEKSNNELLKVPKSIVLDSDFTQPDWDAQLAKKLWTECCKGTSSAIAGYCALLTRGEWDLSSSSSSVPPSTAPDALRHWTDSQKEGLLKGSSAGVKLIELEQKQEKQWKMKYTPYEKDMTWEQFQWCMEVVHSRAFCGDFGGALSASPLPIISAAAPIIAGVAGYIYFYQNSDPNDVVFAGLAVVAALPALLSLTKQDKPSAVLLPLIDSANHLEEADSTIDFSPLTECFTLSTGPKCLVKEDNGTQLYISYGKKSDPELMLNYGFLPNVACVPGEDEAARANEQRQLLAEAFIARNPN